MHYRLASLASFAFSLALPCISTAQSGSAYSESNPPQAAGSMSLISSYPAVSAEILSWDSATGLLFATADTGVEAIDISTPTSVQRSLLISFADVFETGNSVANVSSVAVDPLGRGFAAAALIGSNDTGAVGKVALFNTTTGAIINSFDVGYHPDCVSFSADGEYILVANEGEWNETAQTMGSASVITIGATTSRDSLPALNQSAAVTVDFSAANLADGVSIVGLRVSDPNEGLPYGIEPEYVSYADGKVYCSLQEASAIGVLDIASGKWVDIIRMPYIFQTIDASNKDDGAIIDDSVVLGMPMPDTIGTFVHDGKTYIVTANEGDFNPEDTDKASVKDLGTEGLPALEATYLANLNSLYDGNALATSALGNLNVSIIDGLNSAGEITQLYVPGTRSFSVIDAESGSVVWDSGNDFETITALIDINGYADKRSDDKGPEPEGLCVFEMASERYVAILMERTYAAFLYNISDPLNPRFVDYFRADVGESEPECVRFLSANDSPSARPMLVIGYEDSQTVCLVDIETWMGYPRNAAKPNVDTQGWMGRVYVDGNWAYIWGLDTWIYIEESYMGEVGGWAYMFR